MCHGIALLHGQYRLAGGLSLSDLAGFARVERGAAGGESRPRHRNLVATAAHMPFTSCDRGRLIG